MPNTTFTEKGILKWIGLTFIICYCYDLFWMVKTKNINGIV